MVVYNRYIVASIILRAPAAATAQLASHARVPLVAPMYIYLNSRWLIQCLLLANDAFEEVLSRLNHKDADGRTISIYVRYMYLLLLGF